MKDVNYNHSMNNVKHSSTSGTFHPADKNELELIIDEFLKSAEKYSEYSSRAIIAPHAGYIYSGQLAAEGFKYLDKKAKNVFIIAPSHYARIYGFAVPDYDGWETPLGTIEINKNITDELNKNFQAEYSKKGFEREHAIEAQIPFVQSILPDAKIVPIVYGCENYKNITEIIDYYWENPENAFVISSDLSHYYPEREANRIDAYTAQLIENGKINEFEPELACGAVGISALVDFAKEKKYSLIRVGLTNSAKRTGDTSKVVGYGSWFVYDGEKTQYIKEYFSDYIIRLCKDSILSGFHLGNALPKQHPAVLDEKGACFVTLEIDGRLRGCIGSIIAHRPLINDIVKNAHAAAFSDPRFSPLTKDEFEKIEINVSILTKPERIEFKSEEDLLEKIVPYKDGIIIRDGEYQAVYLPIVWEQLPDKKLFMASLKEKAGLPANYFSESLQVYRFYTTSIKQ